MTAAGPAAAIACGVGKAAANSGHAASTLETWVWWSITSETSTSQRSRVTRHGKAWRPWRRYHERRDADRAMDLLADGDRDRSALRELPTSRTLRHDDAARSGRGREVHDHVEPGARERGGGRTLRLADRVRHVDFARTARDEHPHRRPAGHASTRRGIGADRLPDRHGVVGLLRRRGLQTDEPQDVERLVLGLALHVGYVDARR